MDTERTEEIAPGAFLAYSTQPTSYTRVVAMVVARADGEAIVLDTGVAEYMPAAILPALEALQAEPVDIAAICSTHGHFDHSGGSPTLRELSGAPTYLASVDTELAGFTPDVAIGDGFTVQVGGLAFEVLATPGHTAGSVCFYERSRRLLIAGDAVQGSGSAANGLLPVYFQSGREYRASLGRLLNLPIDTLVMGHPLEWSGIPSCVHHGDQARSMLAESLEASTVIATAVEEVQADSLGDEIATLRHAVLSRLKAHPLFSRFDPDGLIGESTNATLRSEIRDLGIEVK
jgi:hydroxyacylglutathione hydrolase